MADRLRIANGSLALALKIQEAAGELSSSDVMARLRDALADNYRGTGNWAYVQDYFGDDQSGDVVYSSNGDFFKAPYEISGGDGSAAKCIIVFTQAADVVPRTIYEEEADEDDHYAAMEESYKEDGLYTALPLYERFISKGERAAADSSDFAGKGKSFPILKAEDVAAAAHALGRAGSDNLGTSTIKSRIIAIAKRKGWQSYLPKAWQGGGQSDTKESADNRQSGDGSLTLVESAASVEVISLRESAKADYEIKLIAPGKGATAYYPADVLKRDGPKAFPAETKVYLNHPTAVQESEGEGNRDVTRLAGVLTSPAEWRESHPKGPGLYSRIKVFADHAPALEEKAKYLAMSIMAGGAQLIESGKKVYREGLPVLAKLTYGESVDIVPKAGAGGLILAESARRTNVKTKEAGKKDCADCKGSGDCSKCDGTGKMAKAMEAKSKGKPKEMVECTDCQGSGDCATCDGDGVMESARSAAGDTNMDEATFTRLIEKAVAPLQTKLTEVETKLTEARAMNQPLLERALRGDAIAVATEVVSALPMKESAKQYVITECVKSIPQKDGKFDDAAFRESVTAKAKQIAAIAGSDGPTVWGMGSAPVSIDVKEAEKQKSEEKALRESAVDIFSDLMGGHEKAAKAAVYKGVAA